jgi:hypothetical protein
VVPEIGLIREMQSEQTGSREIFVNGEPHRRQSEGKITVKTPFATSVAPETAEFSRFRPARPSRPILALSGGTTGLRIMSPILLKT